MKKILVLTIVLSILFFDYSYAQIVISGNELPSTLGTTWTTFNNKTEEGIVVDVGSKGENQQWEFTQQIDGIEIKHTVVSLDSTPFAADFSESDFVIKYEGGLLDIIYSDVFPPIEGDVYFYQQITDTAVHLLGTGFISDFTNGVAKFEPPNIVLNLLPTQYLDVWISKSRFTIVKDTTILGITGEFKLTVDDSAYSEIDGWGKIVIPLGEFDCLRMKSYVTMDEQVSFNDVIITTKRSRVINYNWVAEDYGLVMRIASHNGEQDDNFDKARFFSRMSSFTPACLLGDVNMDRTITPGDALCAFRIYLNSGIPPEGSCDTYCALAASDANCDDAVTPGDALIIFKAYLNGLQPPLDCPPTTEFSKSNSTSRLKLSLDSVEGLPGEEIAVSIHADNPQGLSAFCMDLGYPDELLTFVKVSATSLTKEWQALDGKENIVGVVTIGGFSPEAIKYKKPGALTTITFKVKDGVEGQGDLWLFNLADDVANAETISGKVSIAMNRVRKIEGCEIPTTYALEQNYPNPFNLETEIVYRLPEVGYVSLSIYNSLGQRIRTLLSCSQNAGKYVAYWNGKDEQGQEITSGVYIYRLETSNFCDVKKMLLMK